MFIGREAELKFLKNVLLSNSKNTGRNGFSNSSDSCYYYILTILQYKIYADCPF